jgi:hypothetical protein
MKSAGLLVELFISKKTKNTFIIKRCQLDGHYGTFLVAQQASNPAEHKHVDQDKDVDYDRL